MAPQATPPSAATPTSTGSEFDSNVSRPGTIAACAALGLYLVLFLIILIGYFVQKASAKKAPPPVNWQPQIAARQPRAMSQSSFLNGPEAPRVARYDSSEADSRQGNRSRSSSTSTARYYYPERYGNDQQPTEQTVPTIPVVKING